jgi:hypothetical protein
VPHIEADSDSFLGFSSARTVHRELVYRPLQFHKHSQHFIAADDEPLSATMRVNNPNGSTFEIEQ